MRDGDFWFLRRALISSTQRSCCTVIPQRSSGDRCGNCSQQHYPTLQPEQLSEKGKTLSKLKFELHVATQKEGLVDLDRCAISVSQSLVGTPFCFSAGFRKGRIGNLITRKVCTLDTWTASVPNLTEDRRMEKPCRSGNALFLPLFSWKLQRCGFSSAAHVFSPSETLLIRQKEG